MLRASDNNINHRYHYYYHHGRNLYDEFELNIYIVAVLHQDEHIYNYHACIHNHHDYHHHTNDKSYKDNKDNEETHRGYKENDNHGR